MSRLQSVERSSLRLVAELCATYTPAGREAALLPPLEAELTLCTVPRGTLCTALEAAQPRKEKGKYFSGSHI
jgi:hypothetical protein